MPHDFITAIRKTVPEVGGATIVISAAPWSLPVARNTEYPCLDRRVFPPVTPIRTRVAAEPLLHIDCNKRPLAAVRTPAAAAPEDDGSNDDHGHRAGDGACGRGVRPEVV